MGLFSRSNDDDRDFGEEIERAKREGSELRWIKHAHARHDAHRPAPKKATGPSSGPSCESASTPKRGRRW